MFQKQKTEKISKGINGIKFIYGAIVAVILLTVVVNLEVNVFWLQGFLTNLRNNSIDYEYSEAHHVAGMMEQEANLGIEKIKSLAQTLSIVQLNPEESKIFIEDFLKKNNHIREISLVNLSGQESNRFSREETFSPSDLKDFSNLEQFEKAKKGEVAMSMVNYSPEAEPYVNIAVPVFSLGTSDTLLVIQAKYYLRGMWESAMEMKIGNTGRISVFDDKGMLIADPQPSRVLKKINLLNIPPVKPVLVKNNSVSNSMNNMAGHDYVNRSGSQSMSFNYLNERNVPVTGVAAPLNIQGMKWGVLVEQDTSEIEAPLQEVAFWLIVFLAGNFIVVVILIWIIFILRSANKKLVNSQAILENEKNRAENEKNKTEAIIANFIDPVIVIDSNNKIILLNPAARNIFGLSEKDLGKRIDPKEGKFSFNDFKEIIPINYSVKEIEWDEAGNPLVEEVFIGDPTSQEEKIDQNALTGSFSRDLIYKVVTRIVSDNESVCYGHMKIFYDFTREKMVDRLKSDFISIVAHQLRTPLSAIKWVISMVAGEDVGKISEEQKVFLDKAYLSNERMIILVNDLLNVSRIEEGKFGYVFKMVDFQEILNAVIGNVEGLVARKHIRVNITKPSKMSLVNLDQSKIILALQNIIDNAIKYTPEYGEITMEIKETEEVLEVRIKDSGVGIPQIDQPRIFSKFFRSSNVVRMETEGSGLGLYIVKNIIEKHKGSIEISSEEGKGTEVVFRIPIR